MEFNLRHRFVMAEPTPAEWHHHQVRCFAEEERPRYVVYAETLKKILEAALARHASVGFVNVRAKASASFAEKAMRKADKYRDPVKQLTDLCGACVIVGRLDEVEEMCRFVRANFAVDEANSLDAASRLRESEFGYRSVHYVVQVKQREILGVRVPLEEIGERKAEIQVRTVLQHAWAAITHDRLYKSTFHPPEILQRAAHRLAAQLEDADMALNVFEREMQAYLGNYQVHLEPKELEKELALQRLLLDIEQDAVRRATIALKAARLARDARRLDEAITFLESAMKVDGPARMALRLELASVLMEKHRSQPGSNEYRRALNLLGEAAALDGTEIFDSPSDKKVRATALAALAEADSSQAVAAFRQALQLDPADPYILCEQLGFNLEHSSNWALVDSARPAIFAALRTCRAHLDAGLEKPRAWLTLGRLHLLLEENELALAAYAKAVQFYLSDEKRTWTFDALQSELDYLHRLRGGRDQMRPALAWAEQLLKLGHWIKAPGGLDIRAATGRAPRFTQFPAPGRVLIIAGSTLPALETEMLAYKNDLRAALEHFEGWVISGGTTAGIPGLVGEVAGELRASGKKRFTLVGYHPEFLWHTTKKSEHYDHFVTSGNTEAESLVEPLQIWVDLLAAGVGRGQVRLLGINGGLVSRFEYALSAALGEWVGLVQSSGRAADETLRDPDWSKLRVLLPLPNDAMTLLAFADQAPSAVAAEDLEKMGRLVHDNYRRGVAVDYRKPNTLPWEALPENFKQSSRDQAGYILRVLPRFGYRLRRGAPGELPVPIREADQEKLAEREHGRWNCERLCAGWRYGSVDDKERKISSALVPWSVLPEKVRDYDFKAVRAYPAVLAAGGYILEYAS